MKEILHLLKIITEIKILKLYEIDESYKEEDIFIDLLNSLENICWSKLKREVELLKITEGAFKE